MNSKRVARAIAIILALIMVLTVLISAIGSLTAGAVPTQAEIDRLREEKKVHDRMKLEIQARINTIEFERMTEIAKKSVLDDRIILTGQEIENINETIALYGLLIIEKEEEVVKAQAREEAQFLRYKRRVRDMEENGVITYLEIVFDSTSFSDLLARIDFVRDIMQADERTYNDLIKAHQETIAAKEVLEQTKQELEEEKVLREEKLDELEVQLEEAKQLIAVIESNLESERALYQQERAAADKIQRDINNAVAEREKEAERIRLLEANKVKGTGALMWPVPGFRTISSGFGIRLHPIYRVYRQHTGIDIGATHGSRVVAADTGTVLISDYNSNYGHYIVISHGAIINGKTVTTLYAHLSSRGVKAGQVVLKGDTIGRIGSTGVSTGPHLHFEVSIGGDRVNPEKYL